MSRLDVVTDFQLGRMIIETCHRCKTPFAMSEQVYDTMSRMKEGGTFYCPLGHPQHYVTGESDLDKVRRERDQLKQNEAYLHDQIREAREDAKKQVAVERGKLTKFKNRVNAGVCPCCNRTFANLARHMKTKHSETNHEK
jgi:hypothetical protein